MTISSTAMRAMVAAGATAEMLIAAVEADERAADVKADKRRTDAAERKRRQRQRERSRDVTRDTPGPSLDGRPSPPAPPHPTLNPSPTPGSEPSGSADGDGEPAGCEQAERTGPRAELMRRGPRLIAAMSGRSELSARQFIGHCLAQCHDEAATVLALIEEADRRELVDGTTWILAQLRERRDQGREPPPGRRPYQPQPTGRAKRQLELIREIEEEMASAPGPDDDIIVLDDQPTGSRGEDRGLPWSSGSDRRPPDQVLRAARRGAFDPRAAALLRRAKPA